MPTQLRRTVLHEIREELEALGLEDPSGAMDIFARSVQAKADARNEDLPSDPKAQKDVSQATLDEERQRVRLEFHKAKMREADSLYLAARRRMAEFGDGWIELLRPIVDKALAKPSLEAEERFERAVGLADRLRRLGCVSSVAGVPSHAYVIEDVPAAFIWSLKKSGKYGDTETLDLLHRQSRPHAIPIGARAPLPRPDEYRTLVTMRSSWNCSLYTGQEVARHWARWPKLQENGSAAVAAGAAQ